jgi:hypothetical protein
VSAAGPLRCRTVAELAMPTGHHHAHLCGRGRGLRQQRPRGRVQPASRKLHVRVATARGPLCVRAGYACAEGSRYLSGRQIAVDTSVATDPARPCMPDTNCPDGGRSGSSGRSIRWFRLVTTSSTLPQGRPCGRPPAAAVLGGDDTMGPGNRPTLPHLQRRGCALGNRLGRASLPRRSHDTALRFYDYCGLCCIRG